MSRNSKLASNALAISVAAIFLHSTNAAFADEEVDIPGLMFQPSVNLVLSVGDVEKSKEFFGSALGIRPMADLRLPGFVMTRFQVGTTEIKLLHTRLSRKTETGAPEKANGIRGVTLYFPDADELKERLEAHGYENVEIVKETGSRGWLSTRIADPDGNLFTLVVPPTGASDDVFDRIDVDLTVNDLDRSSEFYGKFIGFPELDPIDMGAEEPTRVFRHGNTTIRLSHYGTGLPEHTGTWQEARGVRYIQYIVRDLDAVSDYAKASEVTIHTPIFPLGRLARIMFLADPDGVINEFVGLPKLLRN